MPINANLQVTVSRALRDRVLSRAEGQEILQQVRGPEDVAQVVRALQDAYNAPQGIDLAQPQRREDLNWLLSQLDRVSALPLDRGLAQAQGALNWIAALGAAQDGPGGAPVAGFEPLAKKSFGGQGLAVSAAGQLSLGAKPLALDLAGVPSDAQLEALMGLARPQQLDLLEPAQAKALAGVLLGQVRAALPVDKEAKGKYRQVVASLAALGAVENVAQHLDSGQIDTLLALYADAPNPLTQAVLLRALQEAPCSAQQAQARDGLAAPEGKEAVLDNYDELIAGRARTKAFNRIEGPAIALALGAITFAKNRDAIDHVYEGMDIYSKLNAGREPWDAQELGHMAAVIETYVDTYPQTAYVFGTFSTEAPQKLAKLTNERVSKQLSGPLQGAQPSFDGVQLTAAQAAVMKGLLGGIKDEASVTTFSEALSEAADLMSPQLRARWGAIDKAQGPLGGAAFDLFARVAAGFKERQEGAADGMIDAKGLLAAVKAEVGSIKEQLVPRLTELQGQPPKLGAARLSPEAAKYVKGQLSEHLRSEMSVVNVVEAVQVIAEAHGGKLEGEGLAQLSGLIQEYKANWPGRQVFDFNKLGRMARFKVQGQQVPLSTINGRPVGLSDFYSEVAKGVAKAFVADKLTYPWMAERLGLRAREAVEVLDVIAQRTAEGAGPIAELQRRHPGAQVTVAVTGADGAHEQFIFDVKGKGRFIQDSEGALHKYQGRAEPLLFSAKVGADGAFDVAMPAPGSQSTKKWPLQTAYSVGDDIDVAFLDPEAAKVWEEGKAFSDEHKVLQAKITGFDGAGRYKIAYNKPNGDKVEATVSLRDITDANNPHHFELTGSQFSDVAIDIKKDATLKKFLDEAQPIIDQFLPRDGTLLELSATQLAKRQKDCVAGLMKYVRDAMKYPTAKDAHPDDKSAKYHELIDGLDYWGAVPMGQLLDLGKGVCRHQCIAEHLLMQVAGIDSRLASGAANERDGRYRGLHIWMELSLADNARYLSDQTWNDAAIPLWNGAYDTDKRRVEMFHRTDRYRDQVV